MTRENAHVLLVDDEPFITEEMAEYLEGLGIECTVATSGEDAVKAACDPSITHMVLDLRMEGTDGFAVLDILSKRIAKGLKVAAVSGHAALFDQAQARERGVEIFFKKPVDLDRLVETFLTREQQHTRTG